MDSSSSLTAIAAMSTDIAVALQPVLVDDDDQDLHSYDDDDDHSDDGSISLDTLQLSQPANGGKISLGEEEIDEYYSGGNSSCLPFQTSCRIENNSINSSLTTRDSSFSFGGAHPNSSSMISFKFSS